MSGEESVGCAREVGGDKTVWKPVLLNQPRVIFNPEVIRAELGKINSQSKGWAHGRKEENKNQSQKTMESLLCS